MKKLNLLFLFCCFFLLGTMAEPIDQTKALTAAQSFLKNKRTASGARRYAPGQVPQITLAGQVNGLYVYNVKNRGGFVIVSNDDATIPILGFSDSGNIDINHMPDNMKAWLQGYADEIAWYQKHGVKEKKVLLKTKAGRRSTELIAPLLTTKWNQDSPYNDLCPFYEDNEKAASGCVATAMAQVMNYYEWPKSETTAIPGYTTASYEIDLSAGLPATTFDWTNMKDIYSDGYTYAEGVAVATLMQYCGYAVKMDYGPSSGSYPEKIVEALLNYFDYNETAQIFSRDLYNTANWTELIYHEIANGRPVLYSGTTPYEGHQFVCDGYKYENGTDFFHINWGWGGMSDDYFVLSALDPFQQGIGGSSSDNGFNYNQQAIVGIQPSTGTGTIADVSPKEINLTVNSMTPSANPTYAYMPVDVTLNVTNNSTEDYEGAIYLVHQYEEDDSTMYAPLAGDDYFIPAGETKDIVITFTPYGAGTYNLLYFVPVGNDLYETDFDLMVELEVTNSELSDFVPVYINENNELSLSQFIIPATELQDKLYANLNSVTLYAIDCSEIVDPDDVFTWGAAEFDVCLAEVAETTFADATLKDWASLERVYSGRLTVVGNEMKIIFDTPYQYMGGNLLVGIRQKSAGDYKNLKWIGSLATGASLGGSSSDNTPVIQQDILPVTHFGYTPGTAPVVAKPLALFVNYTDGETAEVKWTSAESAWDIEVNGTVTKNVTNPYTLTDLEPATVYTIRVRAKNGSDVSEWSTPYTFNTELADDWCQLRFELTDDWSNGWDGAAIQVVDKLTGVVIGKVYNVYHDGYCGIPEIFTMDVPVGRDIDLVWVSGVFDEENSYVVYDANGDIILSGKGTMSHPMTYYVDCATSSWHRPSNITAEKIGPHSAELSWKENGEATAWVVAYKTADDAEFTELNADTETITLTGLDPETEYFVKVRPATDEVTKWSAEAAFTTDIPNAAPIGLAVTPYPIAADVTWEMFADSYEVRYGVLPQKNTWLQYDNDTYKGNWGQSKSTTLTWGVMYPNNMVKNRRLTKVSWYEVSQYFDSDITVKIYSGTDAPGTLLYSTKVKPNVNGGFHELKLPSSVSVIKEENLWIMLSAKGTKMISYCKSDEPNNQWIYKDDQYEHLADWKPEFTGYGFMIRGYVEAKAWDENDIDWTTTTCNELPCQLTGLTPETDYMVQVCGDYGEAGISKWTSTTFTTVSPCDAPNTLEISDITANTADVTWMGYQDTYDLRYKAKADPDMTSGFDDSTLGDWTNIDADGDGYEWVIWSTDSTYNSRYVPYYYCAKGQGHNGSADKVISASYSNATWLPISPDNYLVSPQVPLGGAISFWAYSESSADFKEHFGVAVSTTGNTDAADFTTIDEWTMDAGLTWKQYYVDLSAYEGQTGYVAIRHFGCRNQVSLTIDDIVIEMPDDETPWITVENIGANSYVLTALADQTDYKVQVRGSNTPCGTVTPWSRTASFSTLNGGTTGITPTDLRESQNSKLNSGWFSLDGRRLGSKPTQKGIYIHNGKKVVI